jgi:hypothetical protein
MHRRYVLMLALAATFLVACSQTLTSTIREASPNSYAVSRFEVLVDK